MNIIDGKLVSLSLREKIKDETELLYKKYQKRPKLAVILVGNNPASLSYVKSKAKAATALGFLHEDYFLDENISEAELLKLIDNLNKDINVDGILIQLPLPSHINKDNVILNIDKDKDVDGFHPYNVGKMVIGDPTFIPCTPKGILELLDYYRIETKGKRVTVIGRSNIVGKPISILLMQRDRNATVTVCNSHTKDLKGITLNSDIIIVAIGRPKYLTADMVSEGAAVIDVGINRVEDKSSKKGYRIVGDVDFESVKEKAQYITPVPGGVGPMTITILMQNTLKSFKKRVGEIS